MSRFRTPPTLILSFILLLASSCSRPAGLQDASGPQTGQPQIPLNGGEQNRVGSSNPESAEASHRNGQETQAALPFGDPRSLPAGTLLTVRLVDKISAEVPDANGTSVTEMGDGKKFHAIVDDPVVIDGVTLIPQGVSVSGMVESARASSVKPNRGYIRLSLASIDIAGRNLPIQTSALFARGNAFGGRSPDNCDSASSAHATSVCISKGRRLTFRLSGPMVLASEHEIMPR